LESEQKGQLVVDLRDKNTRTKKEGGKASFVDGKERKESP
jgi:hypothetical protein